MQQSFLTCLDCGSADHNRDTIDSGGTSVFARVECIDCGNTATVHDRTAGGGRRVLDGDFAELTGTGLQTFRANLDT